MKKESKVRVQTAAMSDIGRMRKANEDSYLVADNENLIIVCDGMGGQIAGGLASKLAVETIKDVFHDLKKSKSKDLLEDIAPSLPLSARQLVAAVRIANRRIYTHAARFPKLRGMGTTVVALVFDKHMATMVHVGDSRILRVSDGKITQLTEDHSWLNELIEDNEINEEQIETFTQKNVITRALGTCGTVKVDVHCEKYRKNDAYVLCTDGLHSSIPNEEINEVFRKSNGSLETVAKQLVQKAWQRDGTDNITIALARTRQASKSANYIGASMTIDEEDVKIQTREDKYIQQNYGDSKSKMWKSPSLALNQQTFLIGGLLVCTWILFFLLGMVMQSKKRTTVPHRPVMAAGTQIAGETNSKAGNAAARQQPNARASQAAQTPEVIKKSALRQDAVMAIVFFNNQYDYQQARLSERAMILDELQPYRRANQTAIQGDFSIFLIDSANNVIRKTSGITLPEFDGVK